MPDRKLLYKKRNNHTEHNNKPFQSVHSSVSHAKDPSKTDLSSIALSNNNHTQLHTKYVDHSVCFLF